ncbi:MAG: hypothetical protein COB66_06820 [Coxiella sp. (in: Bacteria)]|nr:MAG: hypothetical protein COB66_06820 [Coxiella sp. (in: g-proteobacteria)]
MKKYTNFLIAGIALLGANCASATLAPQCTDTWNKSSAGQSCGVVCTAPGDRAGKPFNSSYNKSDDTCSYNSGCCEGMPYQQCIYPYAVCDASVLTVKRGDSNFHNDHGHLVHS